MGLMGIVIRRCATQRDLEPQRTTRRSLTHPWEAGVACDDVQHGGAVKLVQARCQGLREVRSLCAARRARRSRTTRAHGGRWPWKLSVFWGDARRQRRRHGWFHHMPRVRRLGGGDQGWMGSRGGPPFVLRPRSTRPTTHDTRARCTQRKRRERGGSGRQVELEDGQPTSRRGGGRRAHVRGAAPTVEALGMRIGDDAESLGARLTNLMHCVT